MPVLTKHIPVERLNDGGYNDPVEAINSIKKERRRHRVSLSNAVEGLGTAFRTQPNFLYHSFFSLCVIVLGIIFKIDRVEWLVLVLTIVLGMVIEMANTAIESVVDLVTDVWHEDAKVAKDVAAGMMLLFAYGAVLVALIIFLPYFVNLFHGYYLLMVSR